MLSLDTISKQEQEKSNVKGIFRKKEKKNHIQLTFATNIDGILWFIHVRMLA